MIRQSEHASVYGALVDPVTDPEYDPLSLSLTDRCAVVQDAVKSKTATVLAIEAARARNPSACDPNQNVVLQTPEEDRCPPIPGENPLIDLLHRSPASPFLQHIVLYILLLMLFTARSYLNSPLCRKR